MKAYLHNSRYLTVVIYIKLGNLERSVKRQIKQKRPIKQNFLC